MNDQINIEKRISELESRISVLEELLKGSSSTPSLIKKPLSEQEYLLRKKPKSAIDKTFFLGEHLEKYKALSSFTAKDLKNAFLSAREPLPKNINDMINKNVKRGFFMPVKAEGKDKAWMTTATGEKFSNSIKNE